MSKEMKKNETCPDHPGAPKRNLEGGGKRCAPTDGSKCKFTR